MRIILSTNTYGKTPARIFMKHISVQTHTKKKELSRMRKRHRTLIKQVASPRPHPHSAMHLITYTPVANGSLTIRQGEVSNVTRTKNGQKYNEQGSSNHCSQKIKSLFYYLVFLVAIFFSGRPLSFCCNYFLLAFCCFFDKYKHTRLTQYT